MKHAQAATQFIKDEARTDWHDKALWFVRYKRDVQTKKVPEWEQLRELASPMQSHGHKLHIKQF
jgi:L-lactate dehydrogenase complex protein LldF